MEGDTIPLTLPNCTEICPVKIFLNSVFDVLPENENILCHWKKIDSHEQDEIVIIDNTILSRSASHELGMVVISILLIITLVIL